MTNEPSAEELRELVAAVDAAHAIAAGRIQYLDEPAELPPPPESEPMVIRQRRGRPTATLVDLARRLKVLT